MKKIIINHKNYVLKVHISKDNTTIIDSYQVKNPGDMKSVLSLIKGECSNRYAINKRDISSMICEWRVRNLLHALGIMRSRTCSVDLEVNQPWYIRALYFIMTPLYFHFS